MRRALGVAILSTALFALPSQAGLPDDIGKGRAAGHFANPAIRFATADSVDRDHHVATKALDGLFFMAGRGERNIRTDPAAGVTERLKAVFGNRERTHPVAAAGATAGRDPERTGERNDALNRVRAESGGCTC